MAATGTLFVSVIATCTWMLVKGNQEYGQYMCSLTPPVISRPCNDKLPCKPKSLLTCYNGECCAKHIYALGILQKGLEILRCKKLGDKNPCQPEPCPQGSRCLIDRSKIYPRAICIADDPCRQKNCGSHGECMSSERNGTRIARCICQPGYCGEPCQAGTCEEKCQTNDPCNSRNCGRHGECMSTEKNGTRVARCICQPGFCGESCQPSTILTGDLCTDSNCIVPGSICVNGQCACPCNGVYIRNSSPGLSQSRRICTSGCINGISDTFIDYPATQLLSDNGEVLTDILSLDDCKAECLNFAGFQCVSVEYNSIGRICFLNRVRKDDPTSFIESSLQHVVTFSERKCN